MHHITSNTRQTAMDSIMVIHKLLMIDSKRMQNGRMKIMPTDRVRGDLPADFVGLAKNKARLETSPCQPN
jgi:hypothetical protein